jgi:spore germination cell wall hydrolase CwlJ-like protein
MHLRVTIILAIAALSLLTLVSSNPPREKIIEITYNSLTQESQKQVDCLAQNIYFEAGHEPHEGKMAVALVTLNRLQDPRFPKDICSVVKQKVKSTCQFSWFCERKKNIKEEVYDSSKQMAIYVYANYEKLKDITHGALFYHADYVNPRWRGLEVTTKIGRHIFYKERERI